MGKSKKVLFTQQFDREEDPPKRDPEKHVDHKVEEVSELLPGNVD